MEQKEKKIQVFKTKTEARKLLRECFSPPFILLALIPFEIWKHIMNVVAVVDLKSVVFLSQTCLGFHLLFENLQENDVSIATRFRKKGQIPLAKKSFLKCAINGNDIAMFHLGYIFLIESHAESAGAKWFKKAAEKNNAMGMTYYSRYLKYCVGNIVLSNTWAQKALSTRDPFVIGFCYHYGLGFGVDRDEEKAFKYFEISAKEGNEYGQYRLGDCFGNGTGTEKDRKKAFYWYLKSAEQGNAMSKYILNHLSQCDSILRK